jgi:hypothetical protein
MIKQPPAKRRPRPNVIAEFVPTSEGLALAQRAQVVVEVPGPCHPSTGGSFVPKPPAPWGQAAS